MAVLKIFQKYPRSPPIGRQALSVIFFSNSQRGPWAKKMQGGQSPPQRTTGACRPLGGDRVPPPYISPGRHPLCHFSLKIQEKKRGVRRGKAANLCRIAYL